MWFVLKHLRVVYGLQVEVWYKKDWFVALCCFVGFILTAVLGTMRLGLMARDATMVATFLATQVSAPFSVRPVMFLERPWWGIVAAAGEWYTSVAAMKLSSCTIDVFGG